MFTVSANLIGRFVDVKSLCKRCGSEVETAEHALRDCEWAVHFWSILPLRLTPYHTSLNPQALGEWILHLSNTFTKGNHLLFLTLL